METIPVDTDYPGHNGGTLTKQVKQDDKAHHTNPEENNISGAGTDNENSILLENENIVASDVITTETELQQHGVVAQAEAVPNNVEDVPKLPTELEKYWDSVNENPNDFTGWTYLLQYVEQEVCIK